MTQSEIRAYLGRRPYLGEWLIILAVLGLFVVVIGYDLVHEYSEVREAAEERLHKDSRVIQDNLTVQLETAGTVLNDLVEDPQLWRPQGFDVAAINSRLGIQTRYLPGVGSIIMLDANGIVRASSVAELLGRNLSKRDYFLLAKNEARTDVLYIGSPLLSVTGRRVLPLVRSHVDADGRFRGIVVAALDLSYFETLLKSVLSAPDMWTAVIHGDGALFTMSSQTTRPDLEEGLIGHLLIRHFQRGAPFSLQEGGGPPGPSRRIIAFQTVKPSQLGMDKPLIVAVSRDVDNIFADWRKLVLILGVGTAAVFALAVGMQFTHQRTQRSYEMETARERQARAAAEKQFVVAFYEAPIGMLLKDANGRVLQANAAIAEMLGYSQEAIMRLGLPALMNASDQQYELAMLKELMNGERHDYRVELPLQHKDGHQVWILLSVSGVFDEHGRLEYLIKHLQDITLQREQSAELERLAHFDVLTKLPNRALLEDRLTQSIANAARKGGIIGVCFIDLDRFKPINDKYGHEAGDEVLVATALRMQQQLRAGDTLARLGGDEFVVVLSHLADSDESLEVINRLRRVIEQPIHLSSGPEVSVSASFGTCFYPGDGDTPETLLRHSDRAMYAAKFSGTGHLQFSESLGSSTERG